jgi:glycosidase
VVPWTIEPLGRPHRFRTPWGVAGPARAFPVAAEARRRFGVDGAWVTLRGDVLLADPDRAAEVAARVAAVAGPGEPPLRAADLYAGALLEEVYHLVIARYLELVDPEALAEAERRARGWLGDGLDATLAAFVARFPPPDVAAGEPAEAALARRVDGVAGRQVALEEAWTCFLANENPALRAARPLVDVAPLAAEVPYAALIDALRGHFADRPGLPGRPGTSLFDLLLEPARRHPADLAAQLHFVRDAWGALLGDAFGRLLDRLLLAVAAVREADVVRGGPAGAPPPPDAAALRGGEDEPERFSADGAWMPRVVMIAKSTYVWLDQLARAHGRPIERLDQVPDAELATLARRGITALWLIGVWQRSDASRRIKQLRGQEDALASAYALHDYVIADDLGGEAAFADLKARAARHGLRMATDMVPNHVGVDGRWVVEHPERFVQLDHPPYPAYRFAGPDLSSDPRVEIRIEDHYYDGSDAAVVFERRDRATGRVRYLYHGNDGTTMPWNDTAQLDYLDADVREAVIRTILDVARRSPIIRFDAAMTLAKRHVRRLWYPEPGEGGGVPSRGRYGALTDADFERAMPVEFWREVVDRVAAEVPDTLLLAEAFWMMEGYFVRTLGMHRVYNSAFMHMMREQDNAAYRGILKEVLAFDPRVLQRYVNFMNNPDEETARVQFGDGDRYFAVATLLATMPGLPMFGHGQFEGFHEKYGMEFRRAKWDEAPDATLVARHERELVPLLRRRGQFAEVDGFRLFDLEDARRRRGRRRLRLRQPVGRRRLAGRRQPPLRALEGWLRVSVPQVAATGDAPRTTPLGRALGLRGGERRFVAYHDVVHGLHYLWRVRRPPARRLDVDLDGYEAQVLRRPPRTRRSRRRPRALHARQAGRGVASLDDALDDLRFAGAHEALGRVVDDLLAERDPAAAWGAWVAALAIGPVRPPAPPARRSAARLAGAVGADAAVAAAFVHAVAHLPDAASTWRRLRLGRALTRRLALAGVGAAADWAAAAGAAMETLPAPAAPWPDDAAWGTALGRAAEVERALAVHEHGGVRWFRQAGFDRWLAVTWAVGRRQRPGAGAARLLDGWRRRWRERGQASGDRFDELLQAASLPTAAPRRARSPRAPAAAQVRAQAGPAAEPAPRRRVPRRRRRG